MRASRATCLILFLSLSFSSVSAASAGTRESPQGADVLDALIIAQSVAPGGGGSATVVTVRGSGVISSGVASTEQPPAAGAGPRGGSGADRAPGAKRIPDDDAWRNDLSWSLLSWNPTVLVTWGR